MIRVMGENGLVENGDNVESTGDYHSKINYENYEDWLCGGKNEFLNYNKILSLVLVTRYTTAPVWNAHVVRNLNVKKNGSLPMEHRGLATAAV
jgi:hypothetical protein